MAAAQSWRRIAAQLSPWVGTQLAMETRSWLIMGMAILLCMVTLVRIKCSWVSRSHVEVCWGKWEALGILLERISILKFGTAGCWRIQGYICADPYQLEN